MERYAFYSALTYLKDFHGITMNPDDFETLAWHGWNHIGNKVMKFYKYTTTVVDDKIELPCNVEHVEMITTNIEDFLKPENISREDYSMLTIESFIEGRKRYKSPYYMSGRMIEYERVGNTLYFDNMDDVIVTILYKGLEADEEGLPTLNFKEMEAIADYCAFIYLRKKGMMTKDQTLLQMSQLIQAEWKRACDDARTPTYLDQNFLNDLLDVQASWDRKRFGKSYKALK